MTPRATILIPTWDAADSLGPAIESAQAQSLRDVEILVVGDGATPESLEIVRGLAERDDRIRLLELPKGAARGELNRHAGVLAAAAPIIVYLADDDLLLPQHTAKLVDALATHDLAQSANGYIEADDYVKLLPADLADPRWHEWHLSAPPRNRISITGTAHTAAAYRRLPHGWRIPDPWMPADLTLWRQFLSLPGIRAVTLPEMTTLQFPAPERRRMTPGRIAAQRRYWVEFARRPDAFERLQEFAAEATRRELLELGAVTPQLLVQINELTAERDAALDEIDRLRSGMLGRLRARRASRRSGRD